MWYLGNFDGGIRHPGFWNPESTAWNPESVTVLDSLIWGQGDALTTDARRNWNSLMTLFFLYLGGVISDEDGSRGDI